MTARCLGCAAEHQGRATKSGAMRLPHGWKTIAEGALCAGCLRSRYLRRAATIPIAGPDEGTWAELTAALRAQFVETTRAANWIVRELYVRDVRRTPADVKLGPMPRVYLYPEARVLFPSIAPINLTALITAIERTYRRQRYELIWTGARQLATYRYPTPIPVNEQAWSIDRSEAGLWRVRVRLGDRWWTLRLRGGRDFAIHLQRLEQLRTGAALRGALSLRQVDAQTGDHRSGPTARRRLLLTVAGWFPRAQGTSSSPITMHVITEGSSLLVARLAGRGEVLRLHADDLRQRIAGYEVQRQRVMETLSVARRWVPEERQALLASSRQRSERHRRAMRTQLQQLAAAIASCARAHGAGVVSYDDSEDSFQRPFPWQSMRLAIAQACETRGVSFAYASGAEIPTDEGSAREAGTEEAATC
jgi:hypothetical protein